MSNIGVFAGSFCPFTKGHEHLVEKALPLFDKLFIAIGFNAAKKSVFSVEQRKAWIEQIYIEQPNVEVISYEGLTTDLCRRLGARFLVRGVRNTTDFAAEQELALINHRLNPQVETILLPTDPEYAIISSSLVRELWLLKADYSPYISYSLPNHEK